MGHEPTTDRRRGDDGNTFAEILVAIVLMGTAIIAVIGGIRGVISASKVNEQQARVEAVLTSASDRLRAADYVPCPDLDGDYGQLSAAAAAAVGWDGETVDIIEVQYWDASAGGSTASGDQIEADGAWSDVNSLVTASGCQSDINLTTSRTLQKLTIEVTSPNGNITRSIEVVKSPIVPNTQNG